MTDTAALLSLAALLTIAAGLYLIVRAAITARHHRTHQMLCDLHRSLCEVYRGFATGPHPPAPQPLRLDALYLYLQFLDNRLGTSNATDLPYPHRPGHDT